MISRSTIHMTCINQTTSWLMHNYSTIGARTSHGHTQTHKTHHGPDLGEVTTFPLIVFSMFSHGHCIQMSFCLGTPKLGIPKLEAHNFFSNLRLGWCLNQSCSPHWKLFNGMWHITWTQVNQGDFWLLMVRSQIGKLTPDPSFDHNLCFKYPNGS
jgi:hypothetical protein